MNDYYIYYPCPGVLGTVFYSNVGPGWVLAGGYIQFTVSDSPEIQIGSCYHVALVQSELVPLPFVNINWSTTLGVTFNRCEDCEAYQPSLPCQECPPGYTFVDGDCQLEQFSPAVYTGGTLTLEPGNKFNSYSNLGIRLYDDISALTFPIIGTGVTNAAFTVRDNNGAGIVVPQLATVQSILWGCSTPAACATGTFAGKLNRTGVWVNNYPLDTELCFEFCVDLTDTKQYIIGIGGDNSVKIYIDNVLTVDLIGNNSVTRPFNYWHAFPITLTAGQHTITLCGVNDDGQAAFGAEIYDIDLVTFQANFLDPAVGAGNCGNSSVAIDPYTVFSTSTLIGQKVVDPDIPGEWLCPEGAELIECNGVAQCKLTIVQPPLPCGYIFTPCCGGDPLFFQLAENLPLDVDSTYQINNTFQCYTIQPIANNAGPLPFPVISVADLTIIDGGCEDPQCVIPCNECTCTRFRWIGTPEPATQAITYFDCDLQVQTLLINKDGSWSSKVCVKSVLSSCVSPAECWETETFGDCILDEVADAYNCPVCYQLEDCAGIEDTIYTLNQNIQLYINANQVVQIDGSDVCWIPSVSQNDCSCAITVSVQFAYSNCTTCQNPKGYKLTNCTTGDIIYTTTDLSDYTTVIVEVDCGGCWTVEEIDLVPPTNQPVTVLSSHGNCDICNATFYILEDCTGELDPIYTITDLSDYVNNVITLKYCPGTCWTVSLTDPQSVYDVVYVDTKFLDCPECYLATLPCICQTITNNSPTKPLQATYIDCLGVEQRVTIPIGQTSDKLCLLYVPKYGESNITLYGNCVDNVCPPPPSPLVYRSVRPGYGTAACTTDYYENVVCHFSEWMYKDVLERRYGISNCCPDELMKWEIKKELLDLAVLVNPDYTCEPQANCGCPSPSSCGCGGYTPTRNITCNS